MPARTYSLDTLLCSHADAMLYRGQHRQTGQPVLIKVAASTQPQSQQRLQEEGARWQALPLPALPQLLSLQRTPGAVALILSDVAGISLERYLAENTLDMSRTLHLLDQLLMLLTDLHQHGFLLGSLHPQALLVEPATLTVSLVDLGLARQAKSATEPLDLLKLPLGMQAFIAPEQTGRMPGNPDYRSDFYSLGCLGYRLLTGRNPFLGADTLEIIHGHLAMHPVWPVFEKGSARHVLQCILARLLAKNPAERYQSADGLKADLQICRLGLDTLQPAFTPGRHDSDSILRAAATLYCRDEEQGKLQKAMSLARHSGQNSLIVIRGVPGAGKSALLEDARRYSGETTWLLTARCDQLRRDIPYDPLSQAFGMLVRHILTRGSDQLEHYRLRLQQALGDQAGIIVDLVPELRWLIGEQPAVAALGPSETRHRFMALFSRFIAVFATEETPLLMLLDDLHWADAASLQLLASVLKDPDCRHILLITSLSEQLTTPSGQAHHWLADLRESSVPVSDISLKGLADTDIRHWLANCLHQPPEAVDALARIIHGKTGGQPFFVVQLLEKLQADGLLIFNAVQGGWQWDLESIRRIPLNDDMLELMERRIGLLPASAQHVLQAASCIGQRFAHSLLAACLPAIVVPQLDHALQQLIDQGLIAREASGAGDSNEQRIEYHFLHPRLQQAAYASLDAETRTRTHLRIGERLQAYAAPSSHDSLIFDIASHLNQACDIITTPSARLRLAETNLAAGKKAMAAIAYEQACNYLQAGRALLAGSDAPAELAFALGLHEAQALSALGLPEAAAHCFEELLQVPVDSLLHAEACEHYSVALQNFGDSAGALQLVERGLAVLGVVLPRQTDAAEAATRTLFASLQAGNVLQRLGQLPDAGPRDIQIGRLFDRYIITTYFTEPQRLGLVISHNVQHVLEHGCAAASSVALAWFAMLLGMHGQHRESFSYGEAALQLTQRFADPYFSGKTELLAHAQSLNWQNTFAANEAALSAAFEHCHRHGDQQYASYAILSAYIASWLQGDDLHRVKKQCRRWLEYCARHVPLELGQARIRLHLLQNLLGETPLPVDIEQILADYAAEQNWTDVSESLTDLAWTACLHGSYAAGLAYARRAAPLLAQGAAGNLLILAQFHLASVICLARESVHGTNQLAETTPHLHALAGWAAINPSGFAAWDALARAEALKAGQQPGQAISAYLEACDAARSAGQTLLLGLSSALLGEALAERHATLAASSISEARMAFTACGARALLARLPGETAGYAAPAARSSSSITQQLDLKAMMKSALAISSEIVLDRLVARIMQITVENAGAQLGLLLQRSDGHWQVRARLDHSQPGSPIELAPEGIELNRAVIDYVARTGEPVILGNALEQGDFVRDPWTIRQQLRSVMCMPLTCHTQLDYLLYLENRSICGAFTPDRVAVLGLLASQTAIALENASLYTTLQQEKEAIRDLNANLEFRVAERTAALQQALLEQEAILQNTLTGIVFLRNRVIQRCNESCAAMLGYQPEELRGQSVRIFYQDDRDFELIGNELYPFLASGEKIVLDRPIVHRDGHLLWCMIQAKQIDPNDPEKGIVVAMQDITVRKEAEQALAQAKEAAEEATRTKSLFLANMSHEIRTPLTAILGYTELLSSSALAEQQRDHLQRVQVSASALLNVINNILDFSKIEAGQHLMEDAEFDLQGVLDQLGKVVSLQAGRKQLQLIFLLDGKLPRLFHGDPLRLGQILLNLLSNAIKFTEQGEVMLTVCRVEAQGEPRLAFSIRDTGIGMNPDEQKRLFQSFSQADPSMTRRFGGTGLGLAISQQLVQLMGGKIEVHSTPGKGTTFHFSLPWRPALRPPQPGDQLPPAGGRIMLAIKHETTRAAIRQMLGDQGWDVEECQRVSTVLQHAAWPRFDLLLFDLPALDVPLEELMAQLGRELPHAQIMALSHAGQAEQHAQSLQHHGIAIMHQPWTVWDFLGLWQSQRAAPHYPLARHPPVQSGAPLLGMHILLVEDTETLRDLAASILSEHGARVSQASNGSEALAVILDQQQAIDIVLMDIQMPVMDGITACRRIRAYFSAESLPILAMTAHASEEHIVASRAAGMNDHLLKPIDAATLVGKLRQWSPSTRVSQSPVPSQTSPKPALQALPGLDLPRALLHFGGRIDILRKMLPRLREQYGQVAITLDGLLRSGQHDDALLLVHSLKGVAGTLGASGVYQRSSLIESRLQQGDTVAADDVQALAKEMTLAVDSIAIFEHRLGTEEPPPAPSAAENTDQSSLSCLFELLQQRNLRARRVFETLRPQLQTRFPLQTSLLSDAVEQLDFRNALAIVAELQALE
ncbi:AAA family ATPase [Chitinilyticum piscinae]|uniref:Sensory/regulatory protein RpfC n=1 Tax=Chitinilyticum piscinae TaxID=2866724 RepID=A0A8J7K1A6_9NEIS|nr:AAA family ATPase [Chitinilyticum piscinae]MBE9608407.1 AAA family ATPase [Chitinilyticum piscinae]